MIDRNKNNEDFFKELIKQGNIEKAPEGFADKVMAAVQAETEPAKAKWWMQTNSWIWGSIILGISSLIVMIFMIDFSFMGSVFGNIELDGSRITQFISYLGNGFIMIFEEFSVSSITVSIVIALVALFVVDRLFRRKPGIELHLI